GYLPDRFCNALLNATGDLRLNLIGGVDQFLDALSQPWLYHPEPETEENGRYGGRCQQNLCEYLCPNWHTLFSLVYSAQNGLGQAGHGKKLNEPGHGTKQATHEHQLNLFLAERRPKDVLELFRTQGFHLACQHARYDRRALTVESR